MQVIRIDDYGYFVEDVILPDNADSTGLITVPCPTGFYRPKWDGTAWQEGATAGQIASQKQAGVIEAAQRAASDSTLQSIASLTQMVADLQTSIVQITSIISANPPTTSAS